MFKGAIIVRAFLIKIDPHFLYDKRRLVRALNFSADGDILLDAGGGVGLWAHAFSSKVKSVIVYDKLEAEFRHMFDLGKLAFDADNISWVIGDIQNISLADGSVTLVLCSNVLEHIKEPKLALQEMARVLRAGGYLYVGVPNERFIASYSFPLTRILRRILPPFLKKSKYVRGGYKEWEREAGHIHNFTVEQLTTWAQESGMERVSFHYYQKRHLGALLLEFERVFPRLYVPFRTLLWPLIYLILCIEWAVPRDGLSFDIIFRKSKNLV